MPKIYNSLRTKLNQLLNKRSRSTLSNSDDLSAGLHGTKRLLVLLLVVVGIATLGTYLLLHSSALFSPTSSNTLCSSVPPKSYNVVKYGADPSGTVDSTQAIRAAIQAAETSAGNTVWFPCGLYDLRSNDGNGVDFNVSGPNPITIAGPGRDNAKIIEGVGDNPNKLPQCVTNSTKPKETFLIKAGNSGTVDHSVFTGLTVDNQTCNAGNTLVANGNYITISHSKFLGARRANTFGVRLVSGCTRATNGSGVSGNINTGNIVNDVAIKGLGDAGNADLDFSCQSNGTVSDVSDSGWGVALYIDSNVSVTDLAFTDGPIQQNPPGWYITGPSNNIAITNFRTSGGGGVIDSAYGYMTRNVTVTNEVMTDLTRELTANYIDGLIINGGSLGVLKLNSAASNITVNNTTSISKVVCASSLPINLTGRTCT